MGWSVFIVVKKFDDCAGRVQYCTCRKIPSRGIDCHSHLRSKNRLTVPKGRRAGVGPRHRESIRTASEIEKECCKKKGENHDFRRQVDGWS